MSTVREPAVAGVFYPADADELRAEVLRCLGAGRLAPAQPGSPARLLHVPHAGYRYSGAIAGAGFREVAVPRLVVVLAPNHHGVGAPLALPRRGAWRTPLGDVPIDEAAAGAILERGRQLRDDWRAHARDHALEVELPFLQVLRGDDLAIVPVSVGTDDLGQLLEAGAAIAAGLRDVGRTDPEDVLIVVSGDMSHYIPADEARRLDLPALELLRRVEPEAWHREVYGLGITACGAAPVVAGLAAARALGAREGRLVRYGHSGEVTGDPREVVAYAAVVIPAA